MSNYAVLKTAISNVIKQNGDNEITGDLLQQTLVSIVNLLGLGYQYMGVATPDTRPGTHDARVFYLATEGGTYTYFSGLTKQTSYQLWVLYWDTAWHYEPLSVITADYVDDVVSDLADVVTALSHKVEVLPGTPGIAEGIADTISNGTQQVFSFRKSGGDGVNYMKRIKGNTVAWNQIFTTGYGWESGVEQSYTPSTGALHVSGTSEGTGDYATFIDLYQTWGSVVGGHKYFVAGFTSPNVVFGEMYNENTTGIVILEPGAWEQIFTAVGSGEIYGLLRVGVATGESCDFTIFPIIVDLTVLFNGSVPPNFSVADFHAMFPEYSPAHNDGVLASNDATAIETIGFNQWDEEWVIVGTHLESKNTIPVIGGVTYYFYQSTNVGFGHGIKWYDKDGNLLKTDYSDNDGLVAPENAVSMTFGMNDEYGTTYLNDICINISDSNRNGEYEPYWKRSIALGLDSFQVKDAHGNVSTIAGGLKGAGTSNDEILDGKKYTKRIMSIDLGTQSYNTDSDTGSLRFQFTPSGRKPGETNLICSGLTLVTNSYLDSHTEACISGDFNSSSPVVYIKYPGATTVDELKDALSGVILYYELATPEEYDLVNPVPNAIMVDENGTERAIDGNAPFACDSNYSISIKNLLTKLSQI